MKSEPIWHTFGDKTALHEALALHIIEALQQAIETRGNATIALSGGSTPKPLFERLSTVDLDWSRITVTLVDERWVATDSDDSNEKLVRTTLLQNHASTATFIGLKTDEITAQEGVAACATRLATLPSSFDVVILGMGADGHTASFFPHAEALDDVLYGTNVCGAVTPLNAPHERMTLTLPRLLDTHHLILHIEGDSKFHVLQEALQGDDVRTMPVRALFQQDHTPIEVYCTEES